MTIKVARISPSTTNTNPDEAAAIMIVIAFPVLPAFCVTVTDGKDKEDKIDDDVTLLTGRVLVLLVAALLVLPVVDGVTDEESVLSGDVEIIVVVGIER